MSSNLGEFVRYFDFSKVPVSLKVNKSDSYSSFAGGLCSLIMIVVIAMVGSLQLMVLF